VKTFGVVALLAPTCAVLGGPATQIQVSKSSRRGSIAAAFSLFSLSHEPCNCNQRSRRCASSCKTRPRNYNKIL
jgi:hypothetical protein